MEVFVRSELAPNEQPLSALRKSFPVYRMIIVLVDSEVESLLKTSEVVLPMITIRDGNIIINRVILDPESTNV